MGKKILVVEDSSMMRRILVKTLIDAGHEVVGEASSGEQAIELFDQLKPELVTMDITMRGMNGIAAAKEIKSHDSDAAILVLSNMSDARYREEVERIGVVGMVNKHDAAEILRLING